MGRRDRDVVDKHDWTPVKWDADLNVTGVRALQEIIDETRAKSRPTATHWVTRDGCRLRPAEMTTSHLRNTIRMLRRKAVRHKLRDELRLTLALSTVNLSDGAFDAIESDIARMQRDSVTEFLLRAAPTYKALVDELKMRAFG